MPSGAVRRISITLFMCLSVLIALSAHQDPGSQEPPHKVFSSKSEAVLVHVTVRDTKSRLVAHLPKDAFQVFENGQPQAVTYFDDEDRPVTVGLVVDSSGSMQRKRDDVIAAGLAFARSSHPKDEMFTV